MRKDYRLLCLLICTGLFYGVYGAETLPQSDKRKTVNAIKPVLKERTKEGILSYSQKVVKEGFILSGQQCGDGDNIESVYQKGVVRLKEMTGKFPALIGADYGWKADNDLSVVNQALLRHWNQGGLVTLSWHLDNPFAPGYNVRANSVENRDKIDFLKLLKEAPGTPERTSYRAEIAKVAEALLFLKNHGVIVLWRPFHEMNGSWFWFGPDELSGKQTNVPAYRALWIDLYKTLTEDYGLDNLIWIYAPNKSDAKNIAPVDAYYPGDEWVDMAGVDIYSDQPSFDDYSVISKFGKPLAVTEIGATSKTYGQYNQLKIPAVLAGKAAYFLQWHSWTNARVSIVDNLHANGMMNHPKVIALEDMVSEK